jgi:hypothetical protein
MLTFPASQLQGATTPSLDEALDASGIIDVYTVGIQEG